MQAEITLRQAAQQALEALGLLCPMQPHTQAMRDAAITALKQALAEPEQEPVAWSYELATTKSEQGYGDWSRRVTHAKPNVPKGSIRNLMPLYTAPPQREHSTDGSPCWCNPDVIEEDGGNVIVHNYDDNWQQYAKPGETAQQCIERHRAEQDALMKLYATPRKPLTDEEIQTIWAKTFEMGSSANTFARALERAHGIGEQT